MSKILIIFKNAVPISDVGRTVSRFLLVASILATVEPSNLFGQPARTIGEIVGAWLGDATQELHAIDIVNNHAVVVKGRNGVAILDLSIPRIPTQVGELNGIDAHDLAIWEDTVCVIGGRTAASSGNWRVSSVRTSFSLVNISNPHEPQLLFTDSEFSEKHGEILFVEMSEAHAFVTLINNGLKIFDISSPTNPVEVAHLEFSGFWTDIEIRGGTAYVISDNSLHVLNIDDPTNPSSLGKVPVTGDTVDIQGRFAYVGDTFASSLGGYGVAIVDISDHEFPTVLEPFDPILPKSHVYATDEVAFVGWSFEYGSGIALYDTKHPAGTPAFLGQLPNVSVSTYLGQSDMAVSNGFAYVVLRDRGVRVYDLRGVLSTKLRISSAPTAIELGWELGILQFSEGINGPWTDLPLASPINLQAIGEKGFFRVKVEE